MSQFQELWGPGPWSHIMTIIVFGTLVFTTLKCIASLRQGFRTRTFGGKVGYIFSGAFLAAFAAGMLGIIFYDVPTLRRTEAERQIRWQRERENRQRTDAQIREHAYREAKLQAEKRLAQRIAENPELANSDFLLMRFDFSLPANWQRIQSNYPISSLIGHTQKNILVHLTYSELQTADTASVAQKIAATNQATLADCRILKTETLTFNHREWAAVTTSYTENKEPSKTLSYIYCGPEGILQMRATAPAPVFDTSEAEIRALLQTFTFAQNKSE